MDLSQQEDTEIRVIVLNESKKNCSICGTSKTPLWRSGPDGPKSLCNACGIKHRKRQQQVLMCKKPDKNKQILSTPNPATSSLPSASTEISFKSKPMLERSSSSNLRQSMKVGLAAFGMNMARLQRQRSIRRRQRSEEEEAAVLLMLLSCGSVVA